MLTNAVGDRLFSVTDLACMLCLLAGWRLFYALRLIGIAAHQLWPCTEKVYVVMDRCPIVNLDARAHPFSLFVLSYWVCTMQLCNFYPARDEV